MWQSFNLFFLLKDKCYNTYLNSDFVLSWCNWELVLSLFATHCQWSSELSALGFIFTNTSVCWTWTLSMDWGSTAVCLLLPCNIWCCVNVFWLIDCCFWLQSTPVEVRMFCCKVPQWVSTAHSTLVQNFKCVHFDIFGSCNVYYIRSW